MRSDPQMLFVAWREPQCGATFPIARLVRREAGPRYEFTYVHGVADAHRHGFFPFRELSDVQRLYLFDHLPPLFTNRVMSSRRPDFAEHVARLDLHGVPSPELLLVRSEARKVTDKLEVTAPPEFDAKTRTWIYHCFARGIWHIDGADDLICAVQPGDRLRIEGDQLNASAIRLRIVRADGAALGFVPQILTEDLDLLRERGANLEARAMRVNLQPAPVSHRLLVVIRAAHPSGFAPMATNRFEPLAECATKIDTGCIARCDLPTSPGDVTDHYGGFWDSLSIDELARRQGVKPVKAIDQLRSDWLDGESVDEFLAMVQATRGRSRPEAEA